MVLGIKSEPMIEPEYREEVVQPEEPTVEESSIQDSDADLAQQLVASINLVTSALPKTTKKGRKTKSASKPTTMRYYFSDNLPVECILVKCLFYSV